MKNLLRIAALVLLLPLFAFSQGQFYYSDQYYAACDGMDAVAPTGVRVSIQNDSIIIEDVINNQCCPGFALKISEIIDDTLYVVFADTTTTMMCDCMCDFNVRLNAGWFDGEPLQMNYNGHWLSVSASHPLIQVGKKWNALRMIPGLDYSMPEQTAWRIESNYTKPFCWNAKFYHFVISDQDTAFVREQNGRVYYIDGNKEHQRMCEEALLYDFTVQVGDTVMLGYDSVRFVVVPIEKIEMEGRRIIALVDLTAPEMSNVMLWIEGIGDTRGLFESVRSPMLVGSYSVLTCCSLNDSLLYQDSAYVDCGIRPDYQFFIEEGKQWTIYTECTLPDFESHVSVYEVTNDNMIDNPYAMRFYPFADDSTIYFQEGNGRVFYNDDDRSYLIYDFSLNVGDSVDVGDPNDEILHLCVDSVKYLQYSDDVMRKTIFLSGEYQSTVWVEGIGDLNSPLFYWMPLPTNGCSPNFTCCQRNDKMLYQNPSYPDCGMANSLSSVEINKISVYPNPAHNKLCFEGRMTSDMTFQIINITGKVMQQGKVEQAIDLSLRSGIYFLLIKDGAKILAKEKLMVKIISGC